MKVTIENKKGLNKDVRVFIDKKTMNIHMDEKYKEIKGTVNLKGFRPGKVPREILKRQFGKAVFNEVLDKVLKDTSTKALEENKIKPAGQPKLDLKTYGEDKDLEYILSVTELPKVEIKSIETIKFDEYTVKIDPKEADKRIQEIAKNQPNFKDVSEDTKSSEKDLVTFDYPGMSELTEDHKRKINTPGGIGYDLYAWLLKRLPRSAVVVLVGIKNRPDHKVMNSKVRLEISRRDSSSPESFPFAYGRPVAFAPISINMKIRRL